MSAEVSGMILRCSKTGKLFFNEVDAKQHNEDTGFAEFEQVSPDDKVWYCLETGKVCQSETEKTIYQKRDKTAITFEEKTIAFLKERYLERKARAQAAAATAGSDEATPMEVDGAPAAAPDPPNISKETLDQLLEMGFPQPRAEKALVRTSNGPLESAITWLSDHAEDADIDVPLELTPTILAQADIDAAAAAKGANAHLTLEEKQAKLQAAIEAAQRKKAESEREEEKAREKARRESGKAMVKTKAELDELQRKRDREARKKEKEDDLRHRQYLREQLEQDKAERRAAREKAGLPPLASDAPKPAAAPPPAPTPAPAPAAPSQPAAEPRVHAPVAVPVVPVADALKVLLSNRDFMIDGYAEVAAKLADNINKQPAEAKYRSVKLSNAKIHEKLIRPTGGELLLVALGWQREGDTLTLPMDKGAQQMAETVAELSRQAEAAKKARADAEREKLRVEREAAMRAKAEEKARLRAAMEADRREISARGPAQAIKASKLPAGSGGLAVNRLNLEEDPEDNRPA